MGITRRLFGQIMSSFVLAPLVRLEPKKLDPHKYLELFVDSRRLYTA